MSFLSLLCYYSHVSMQICDSFTGDDRLRHDKGFRSGFLPGHVLYPFVWRKGDASTIATW